MDIWEKLYQEARRVQGNRVISPFIEAGGVAAALLTKAGNIYVGVCIDTASTLGMCAGGMRLPICLPTEKVELTSCLL